MNKRRKRGNNKLRRLVRRFVWRIRPRKYMIDTRTISRKRPSELQIELNIWQRTELELLGLILPYDGDAFINTSNLVLEYFDSYSEYSDARWDAALKLYDFKPIMEPMRTKLVLETWNICKQIGQDYFL